MFSLVCVCDTTRERVWAREKAGVKTNTLITGSVGGIQFIANRSLHSMYTIMTKANLKNSTREVEHVIFYIDN